MCFTEAYSYHVTMPSHPRQSVFDRFSLHMASIFLLRTILGIGLSVLSDIMHKVGGIERVKLYFSEKFFFQVFWPKVPHLIF